MKYNRQFHPEENEHTGEVGSDVTHVETAGYRTTAQMIDEIMAAGDRLVAYRQAVYDYDAGAEVPDDAVDPTRRPDFDLADASEALAQVQARAEAATADSAAKDAAPPGREVGPVEPSESASEEVLEE